jgi:hypothetical protein
MALTIGGAPERSRNVPPPNRRTAEPPRQTARLDTDEISVHGTDAADAPQENAGHTIPSNRRGDDR